MQIGAIGSGKLRMTYIVRKLALLMILGAGYAVHAYADNNIATVYMKEPLFELSYDPNLIKYEELSSNVVDKLNIDNLPIGGKYWIYGKYIDQDNNVFLIIAGQVSQEIVGEGNKARRTVGNTSGMLVVQKNGKLSLAWKDVNFYGANSIKLPEKVVDGILLDAVQRLALAFGGKEKIEEIFKQAKYIEGPLFAFPPLFKALNNYGISTASVE